MEEQCIKCNSYHKRPVGRRCYRLSMATNITTSQAIMASSAVLGVNSSVNTSVNPVVTTRIPPPPANTVTVTTSSTSGQPNGPSRTEELILNELQKLSARMSNMEQEFQSTTFTSTPRKRKKSRQVNKNRDHSVMGVSGLADTQTTIEESMIENNQLVSINNGLGSHALAVTSASSLFTQSSVVTTSATGSGGAYSRTSTQVTVATCQGGHYRQHVPQLPQQSGIHMVVTPSNSGNPRAVAEAPRPSVVFSGPPPSSLQQVSTQAVTAQHQQPQQVPQVTQVLASVNSQPQCPCGRSQMATQAIHPQVVTSQASGHMGAQEHWQGPVNMGRGPQFAGVVAQQPGDPVLIPSLQALRSTAVDQDMVQKRLDELHQQAAPQQTGNYPSSLLHQDTGHKQNGKVKGKKDKVEVVWPQDGAFVGHQRTRLTYEQLNPSQFVLGYLRAVQEEPSTLIRSNMIEYLTDLFQDVCDMGWQAAKGAHLVVMSKMEDGMVTWSDLKKVNKIRKTYVRSSMGASTSNQQDQQSGSNIKKGFKKPSTVPCKEYNEGRCSKNFDHDVGLITHKHICAYCLYSINKLYNHSENNCNRKRSKNGQTMAQQ